MASMAARICSMSPAPASAAARVSTAICRAWPADAALRAVMLAISSSDALVSSSEAACWLAPRRDRPAE
jgi:hypothetical protein